MWLVFLRQWLTWFFKIVEDMVSFSKRVIDVVWFSKTVSYMVYYGNGEVEDLY